MKRMGKEKFVKVLSFTGNIFIYLFFALSICLLILSLVIKRDSFGAVKLFGHEMFIVETGSMEQNEYTREEVMQYDIKSIPRYSAIFVELVPEGEGAEDWYNSLKVGDVLTFRYVVALKQQTVTHRIKSIEDKQGGGKLITLGADNGSGPPEQWGAPQVVDTSEANATDYVIGKVTGKNHFLGLIVHEIKQPLGIVLLIIVPCIIFIAFEVVEIINVVGASKRERKKETQDK